MPNSLRVVIDTSIFIRYLIRPNMETRLLIEDLWLDNKILVICAPELFDELKSVLDRPSMKTFIKTDEGNVLLDVLISTAEFLPLLGEVPNYTRDPKDNKLLACAILGDAQYVISEDKDILEIKEIAGIKVLTPKDFIKLKFQKP